jgi:ectoine hydroxylase-related dioxygenase (phytanoyl-CoA dioxygenase family)
LNDCAKTAERCRLDLQLRGWSLFENVLGPEWVESMRRDSLAWIDRCNALQIARGINELGDNTGHHTLGGDDSLDRFINLNVLHRQVDAYFAGKPYILHAFNPVGGAPKACTYVHRIHRDAKTHIPGFRLKLNMLVMLDDFTADNGATQLLEGSHRLEDKPPEEYFDKHHRCVIAAAGSIVLFDSNLWHRGGFNSTGRHRVALTLAFSVPFVKPQLDYARMLGPAYAERIAPLTRQILGYDARTPLSLEEWYQTEETRFYKSNQG